MTIDLNPELFNDIYWHLADDFDNEDIRYIFLYGGSSASKTYTFVQLDIVRKMMYKDDNSMIMRKFSVDIKDSIYSDYVNIIKSWGLAEYFKIQINYIECLLTGSYIRFRGLDDSEKIKGLSNFKRVVLEEISQFDEVDLKQIRKRLRGRLGQQIIGIFNPINETHWLKTNVFDTETLTEVKTNTNITSKHVNDKGNFVVYKVNYLNNYYIVGKFDKSGNKIGGFIDVHTIADFEKDKLTDFNYYQIYGLGNWGKLRTGGEFWKDFNTNNNVGRNLWDKDEPLHIVWDENVNPHITCTIWQIKGKNVKQIDEICLGDPHNRVLDACNEFKKRYPQHEVKGLFIYGDRTSIKEDTKMEKGENFFTKIQQYLSIYPHKLRMQRRNPSVALSGAFINEIYRSGYEGISISIGENCKKSLFDYQYALEDSDGTIKKSKKTNPITKVSYEEFGHCFVGSTLITTDKGSVRIDEMKVGDLALTRKGYKRVVKIFNNGLKEVEEYNFDGYKLTCTSDHKILVNNEFISAGLIRKGIFCIFDDIKKEICYEKLSLTTDLYLQDTQMQKEGQRGFILRDELAASKNAFTDMFTNAKLGISKKECISIIKTRTHLITMFLTSKRKPQKNILPNIMKTRAKSISWTCLTTFLRKQFQRQKNGTDRKMGGNGTLNTQRKLFYIKAKLLKFALIARQNLKQMLLDKNIAQRHAIINTKREGSESLKNVYDIQVEGEHEYFANNLLVHNCSDTKRYFLTVAFEKEYNNYIGVKKKVKIIW